MTEFIDKELDLENEMEISCLVGEIDEKEKDLTDKEDELIFCY